jgi:CRP-like cAMP-binding protein
MKETLTKYIKGFEMLTDEEIQLIVDNTTVIEARKGKVLLQEGEISSHCYFVLKGCVREYYIVDGEERSTAFFIEGDAVNSFTSATNETPSKHYLVCAENSILTVGDRELEQEMCARIPRLATIIRQETERIFGIKQDEFAKFVTSSPEERYEYIMQSKPELLTRIPQHQIASYIGVKPESLSRIRKRMMEKNRDTAQSSLLVH